MKIDILGVKFDNLTMDEALERIEGFVVLPYSEFIVRAQKDEEFRKILNSADFCLCESRGLQLVTGFLGKKVKESINGVELILRLNQESRIKNYGIFLFGGKKGVAKETAKRLGNNVIGFEHGYQDFDRVINKINKVKPNILLVGLGSPKQEKFIYYNLKKMPSIKLAIGVGGAFDFISGRIKRAPKFLQKIGLEWLWRLILQPWRIKRIYNGVIKFSWLVLKEKINRI